MAIARERPLIAAAVAAAHLAAILLLLNARTVLILPVDRESVTTFDVAPPPPPPPRIDAEPSGRPAPPAPRARPRPVEAPPVRRPADPAPPVAATGPDTSAGAAEAGPGTGASGDGTGLGAGGSGDGAGGGTRARRLSGRILDSDYPRAARRDRAEGRVVAVFTVGPDGRAYDCRPYRSSGNEALDDTTCRLIEDRFTFDPARDARGRPIAEEDVGWQQDWWFEGL